MIQELLDLGYFLFVGYMIGCTTYYTGRIIDTSVSHNSLRNLLEDETSLYIQGTDMIHQNLFYITPIVYATVVHYLKILDNLSWEFQPLNYAYVILIHNFGYYLVHMAMHNNKYLYRYHSFHHKFDKHIIPSIGNAVSKTEFVTAYVVPMVVAGYITHCTETTFLSSIGTISFCNLLIHCPELKLSYWPPGLISPEIHITHHQVRKKHYSASVVDYDLILEYIKSVFVG